jgi:ABC-type antimicrobial peptide transport system permease subunit
MNLQKLLRLVWQSIRRSKRDFLFSSVGIIIGISTLLFFTSLGTGIKETVLERVFVVRQLEVIKKTYDVGAFQSEGLFGAKKLDDSLIEKLQKVEGVRSVYPKMKLTFPTGAFGGKQLIGKDVRGELVADGLPAELISDEEVDPSLEVVFKDYEAISCKQKSDCPKAYTCGDKGVCVGEPCQARRGEESAACEGAAYCHSERKQCMIPIPVVASPKMLEIYNGSIHTALSGSSGALSKLPKLSKNALVGFEANALFGRSFFLGESAGGQQDVRRIRLVGFSDKAIDLGATFPIGYVKRLNAIHSGREEAGREYHAVVVETESNEVTAAVAQKIEDMGYALSDKFENAQRASLLILLITVIFNLISAIILAVAAVNIMHTFLMLILERRRELGLLRALGATRAQIRMLVLSEATALGLIGGSLGIAVGFVATKAVDAIFNSQVQDFPFKPDTLFGFAPWMFLMCLGAALFFCWIGALLPAIRASRIDPAAALTGR